MSSNRKSPEPTTEVDSEDPGNRWIPMRDAGDLIGVSERAARDWVKRYEIPTRGNRPVVVSEQAVVRKLSELGRSPRQEPDESSEPTGINSEPMEAKFRVRDEPSEVLVPLSTVVKQTEGLLSRLDTMAERYETLAKRNEDLALELGGLRERAERQAMDIEQLNSTLTTTEVDRKTAEAKYLQVVEDLATVRGKLNVLEEQLAPRLQPVEARPPVEPELPKRFRWWPWGHNVGDVDP